MFLKININFYLKLMVEECCGHHWSKSHCLLLVNCRCYASCRFPTEGNVALYLLDAQLTLNNITRYTNSFDTFNCYHYGSYCWIMFIFFKRHGTKQLLYLYTCVPTKSQQLHIWIVCRIRARTLWIISAGRVQGQALVNGLRPRRP
jgi:hypothetical protein